MKADPELQTFLSQYDEEVYSNAMRLRNIVFENLPQVVEQLDTPAKMIAYSYGQKYTDMVCTIIPSKKGLKLGFYKGNELADPAGLLEGNGKISRYVVIKSGQEINAAPLKKLLETALASYKERKEGK